MIKNYLQIIVGALIIMAFESKNATACSCTNVNCTCCACPTVDEYHNCLMDCGLPGVTKNN